MLNFWYLHVVRLLRWCLNGSKKITKITGIVNKLETVNERISYLHTKCLEHQKTLRDLSITYLVNSKGRKIPEYTDTHYSLISHIKRELDNVKIRVSDIYFMNIKSTYSLFIRWYLTQKNDKSLTIDGASDFLHFLINYKTRNSKPLKYSTINTIIMRLKTLFDVLYKNGKIMANPFSAIKPLKTFNRTTEPYPTNLISIIAKTMVAHNPRLWLVCKFIYYCFMRPAKELRKLQISDIDFANKRIILPPDKGKGGIKRRIIIIPNVFFDELINEYRLHTYPGYFYVFSKDKLLPGKECVCSNRFYILHRALLRKANIDVTRYSLYGWKPTGAISYYKKTHDIYGLQRQLGHSSLDMVMRYISKYYIDDNLEIRDNYPDINQIGLL